MDTQRHDYTGWVSDTGRTVRLHFVREERHGGVATYRFSASAPDHAITDPQLSALMPPSMSKEALLELTPSLQLTTPQLLKLDALMKRLPDPVPLAYTYRFAATFWVAPATGIVVDLRQHDVRTVSFVDGARTIPVAPVMDMAYTSTPASLAAAARDARDATAQLRLIRTTAPAGLLGAGIALVLVGAVLLVSRRRPAPVAPSASSTEEVRELSRV